MLSVTTFCTSLSVSSTSFAIPVVFGFAHLITLRLACSLAAGPGVTPASHDSVRLV